MEMVKLFYPPVVLIGEPAPGAWPPGEGQKKVRFEKLAYLQHIVMPDAEGKPQPMIRLDPAGTWNLTVDSWVDADEPDDGERNAYTQWRAAQSNIQIAQANDPLLKGDPPGDGRAPLPFRRRRPT